jgi:hypothetical protein
MAVKADHTVEGGVWNEALHGWVWHDAAGWRHRVDGPAYIHPDGRQEWYLHGLLHRVNGPAVMYADGHQEWWVQGRAITQAVKSWMHDNNITLPFTPEQLVEFELRWL